MRKNWWKILGVALVIYVFIAGLLCPLKSGITQVEPKSAHTGDRVTLQIQGYNSFFAKAGNNNRVWLKLDNKRALGAQSITVKNDRELEVVFLLPPYLPVKERVQDFTLIIDNPIDGASVLPSAVFVTQDSIQPEKGEQGWQNSVISNLHSKSGITFPFRNILSETIRNIYFHVSLWLAMVLLFIGSMVNSIRYLRGFNPDYDHRSLALTRVGIFYGVLGLITGAIWAKNTWGEYWSWDVKQNMTAIALLIYFAYFVLRNAFDDYEKRARLAAVYNIFAFVAMIPLIYVIPRMTDSLHPGNGGNPALGGEDLDNTMRLVFYPAVIGWTLIGFWIAQLSYRAERLEARLGDLEME
jgi:heme exporter protein C